MKKAKVLVVEDESIIALDIKKTLEHFNFEVTDTASSYEMALNSIKLKRPDIILMDIYLNGSRNGIEIIKQIQKKDDIPVIYLSSNDEEQTIYEASKTNPISYLIKPFKKDDLRSNILLGINKVKNSNKLVSLGLEYYYDYKNRKLFYKEDLIRLSKKEELLLKVLVDNNGKTVTFKDLEQKIWPNIVVSNSALRTLIYRLRMRIKYDLIESIPMIGCRLVYL